METSRNAGRQCRNTLYLDEATQIKAVKNLSKQDLSYDWCLQTTSMIARPLMNICIELQSEQGNQA